MPHLKPADTMQTLMVPVRLADQLVPATFEHAVNEIVQLFGAPQSLTNWAACPSSRTPRTCSSSSSPAAASGEAPRWSRRPSWVGSFITVQDS